MKLCTILAIAAVTQLAGSLNAQTFRRQAAIVGGPMEVGRCTVEIVVDGAAEIAIRGDDATVNNLNGRAPELRRFECTTAVPPNPADFRFRGIDGRGRQDLIRPAGQGQPAVIRIEDRDNGSDRYKFEISWRNGGFAPPPAPGPYSDRDGRDGRDRRDRRFTTDQAVQVCKDAVRQQTSDRYRTGDVTFRETRLDDAPGRNDWVIGTLEARRRGIPDQILKFSCSVNFETGQVRSAQVDPVYSEGDRGGDRGRPGMNPVAVRNCQRAITERVRRDGYDRISFGDMRVDDRPGRNDWIMGDFQAAGRYGPETLHYSCLVENRDGDVKSIDVTTRR
jgi:hypothetical protein